MPYRRLIRAIAGGLAALAVMLVFLIAAERIQVPAGLHVPARYNPFADFDLAEEPDFWTRLKFRRASQDAGACRAALARAGLRFDPVPDQATGEGCGLTDAGRIQRVGEAAAHYRQALKVDPAFVAERRDAVEPLATAPSTPFDRPVRSRRSPVTEPLDPTPPRPAVRPDRIWARNWPV